MPVIRGHEFVGNLVPTSLGDLEPSFAILLEQRDQNGQYDRPAFQAALVEALDLADSTASSYRRAHQQLGLPAAPLATLTAMSLERGGHLIVRQTYLKGEHPLPAEWPRLLIAPAVVGHLHGLGLVGARAHQWLLAKNLAGTANAANAILATGHSVGRFFGLLDLDDAPTPFYDAFYTRVR